MLICQAEKIHKSCFKPDLIVGVSRGGWIPARVLSDLLENPNVASVRVEFYFEIAKTRKEPLLTQGVSVNVVGKKVLIVDDVADTGKSLEIVEDHLRNQGAKEARIATLYYKPWSKVKPDYYEKETTRWIVFPWDAKETIRRINEKHEGKTALIKNETAKLMRAGLPKPLATRFQREITEMRKC
jgi:hypoxanthine phosphoribosyltransferase